jgi:DNA polymerase elongation subunit (family B)
VRPSLLHAHLFDVYPTSGGMAVWLIGVDGARLRLVHPWTPRFYYSGSREILRHAQALLDGIRATIATRVTTRCDLLRGEIEVVEVTVADPMAFSRVVDRLAHLDGLTFYNCDIALPQMYLYEHQLFPLGRCAVETTPEGTIRTIAPLESPWEQEYTPPSLVVLRLRLDGDPANPNHGRRAALHVDVDGESSALTGETPEELLDALDRWIHRYDPDIVLTEWGDSFLFPRLRRLAAACGHPLSLNRDAGAGMRTRRPRSYMTYGQIVYTAGGSYLRGRWHLDTANSFTYEEAELPGLLELARLARMPVQHTARTSVGTAITSMQLDQAYQDGILIPWRKSRPEAFKSANDLLLTDRGGLTYMPLIGAFEQVGELDFAAMYPAMMSRFNISQETVNCACCRGDPAAPVPGVPHHLCQKRRGLTPRVLQRVLERRAYYKRRRAETTGPARHLYNMRQTALKWIGVVCLDGDTIVLHKSGNRWRIAPIREIVDAHLPPDTTGIKPVDDLAVIGIDNHLRPCIKAVRHAIKMPAPQTMIRARLKWNRELLMTPDHPCYVLEDGHLAIKRADELTIEDWIPIATSWKDVADMSIETIDLLAELKRSIPLEEQQKWRVFGPPICRLFEERGDVIRTQAMADYSTGTMYNWRQDEYLPLHYVAAGDFSPADRTELKVGFGRLNGGEIQRIPAVVRIDDDLGFLLGFFVGDGSISGNMVRFDVGLNEPEIVDGVYPDLKIPGCGMHVRRSAPARRCLPARRTCVPVSLDRALCQAARVIRVPRIDRTVMVSRRMADLKLGQVTKKHYRFKTWMQDGASSLELLLHSSLGFAQVASVEKIAYSEKFVYCFEVAGEPAAFFIDGGVLTHNCFGYQGYKNARFGQIEAHECTTALGREMLLRAKDVAESQGYTMLHALVDSVWLQRPGATRADYEALARTIADATNIPIAVEGVYRWIAFVPSRTHPLVGVPNRYFGVFEDGTEKVRGIELRRGDTPSIVAAMQRRMLDLLFDATTLDEVRARLPILAEILEEQCVRLRQHEVRAEELVIRTVLSQDPREYEKGIPQAVAAHQLAQAGVALHPGEAIEYIIRNAASKIPGERAIAYARLPSDWSYDVDRYVRLLRRAADTLLAPFGHRLTIAPRAAWPRGCARRSEGTPLPTQARTERGCPEPRSS